MTNGAAVKLLPVVAVALIDPRGCLLVQQRPQGKHHAGLWEFPGGKIEPGEGPEAALVRELGEELGITVAIADLEPVAFASEPRDDAHLLLLLYRCRAWQGVPQPLDADALQWSALADLKSLAMPPADRALTRTLQRRA